MSELQSIWTFKHEPKTIDEMVLNEDEKEKLKKWINEAPNMLLAGPPGVGKGTFANIFLESTGYDYIKLNCSDETGIENVRNKVKSFACALGTTDLKIVYLNECLEENEEIMLVNGEFLSLKDFPENSNVNVKSLNMETGEIEDDVATKVTDKENDIYEIELEDGRLIKSNLKHPFIIVDSDGTFKQQKLENLRVNDYIYTLYGQYKIASIEYKGKGRVINLNVWNNSTFITQNGIPTHNCDYLSPNAQAMLRDLVEQVEEMTRFIFACNYPNNLIPELVSRCRSIYLQYPPYDEAVRFCKNIIQSEGIELANKKDLIKLIKHTLPDVRNMVLTLQENCKDGKFESFDKSFDNTNLYENILEAIKSFDPEEVRKILKSYPILYNELFSFMYEKVMENPDLVSSPGEFIIKTGEYYYKSQSVAIKEILFMTYVFELLKGGFFNKSKGGSSNG